MIRCPGKEIGNPFLYRVLDAADCTVETSFHNFCVIFLIDMELKIAFADRAAENGEKGASHT